MSGNVPPLLPSVFISYASSDRTAARALRDCLVEAGLEVWLDEEELAGGEAWDAKIRNQIRSCTYFMPVISATTEQRREGYFRREWRLAVERTLDIADDVMFLLPVVIDDTPDAGARVPERFFSVQWLRVPGGRPTPALRELARKLATGEAVAVPVAPRDDPVVATRTGKARRHAEPPPFPKFPEYPEHGNHRRFVYDLIVWFGLLLRSLWLHLPRWVRVIAAAVIVFNLIGWLFRDRQPAVFRPERTRAEKPADSTKALRDAGAKLATDGRDGAAAAIQSLVQTAAEVAQAGRPVALVPFSADNDAQRELADEAFGEVCELLQQDGKPLWGVNPFPIPSGASDSEAISRGLRMKSRFVLVGHAGVAAPGLPAGFTVRLFEVGRNEMVWKETFALTDEPAKIGRRIADEVMQRLNTPAPTVPPPPPAPTPAGG